MKTQPFILSTIIFTFYILFLSDQLFSKEVDLATIKNVALNVYAERAENPIAGFNVSHILEYKEKGEIVFYTVVFSGKGFALISADDIVQPVLGYSFESEWDENNHSPAFKFYILERFKKQIYTAKQAKLLPDNETILEWQNYSVSPTSFQPKNVKSSTPLIETEWGQSLYYNTLCPEDPTDTISGHVPVGCVATAMAQVLNYWQHPWHGTGSHSYTPEDHPEYGEQSANFDTTLYNFDYMPNFPNNHSADLAELMYHCAVSVNMNFGPDGSGAWGWSDKDEVSDALKSHFYFNSNTEGIRRSTFPITWVDKMKENLDANRPVIYGAEDNQEDIGHAWILDAYTTGDMFHCNWGWSGSDDGWYSIDDFSPPGQGLTFDVYETATVKIYPHAGNLSGTWDVAGSPYYLDHDYIINASDQLNIEPGVEIIYNGRYKIIVYGQLNAIGTETDSIKFTPEYPEIGWRGTWFYNTNENVVDTSKIKYCVLNNGNAHHTDYPGNIYRDGGALMCSNSSKVEVSDCTFKYNKAYSHGGSIACVDSSNILIKDCLISHSEARTGGGIYVFQSRPVITGNTIHNNTATEFGGGLHGYYSNFSLNHTELYLNSSQYGGAIEMSHCYATMDSLIIHNNSAEAGGAILINNSTANLLNCEVKFNSATLETAGVQGNPSSIIYIEKMLNYGNTGEMGGGLGFWTCNPTITKSTIYNNNATEGAGIYLHNCSANMSDLIIWDNSPDQVFDDSGTNSINYSIIEGGFTGTGNVNADPLFANETWFDLSLTWPDYPIPDGNKSPAIDSGDPSSALDPDGTRADMGALPYEQTYTIIPAGNISGTLTCAGSPYYINGDLEILATDELIIEPCVTMIFQGDYQLEVRGRLSAVGTETDQITFAAADTLEGWQGIRFIQTKNNGQDSSRLANCRITFGNANGGGEYNRGGALYFSSSGDVLISNCLVNKNKADNNGGAIYSTGASGSLFINNIFENNYSPSGGVFYGNSTGNLYFTNNTFQCNRADAGGALCAYSSNIYLKGNTFRNNRAEQFGGAIYYASGGNFFFDAADKNDVYLNYAGAAGTDFYYAGYQSSIAVTVDTFTVFQPNKHFAYPLNKFNLTVDHGIIEQTDSDLYVSMSGSDENSGTSESEPLKTMHMACMKIMADETNPHTIYLDEGTYSEGATGEVFPINWRSHVSMHGSGIDETTIYGEDKNQLLYCYDDTGFHIDSLNFQGGYGEYGGAIRLENESSPAISNIEVYYNYAVEDGGAIFCDHSSPSISEISVHDNSCEVNGGGIRCYNYSNATILNSEFYDNFALYRGGGISIYFYSDVIMDSLSIMNNTAVHGGGLYIGWESHAQVKNTTIQGNDALSHVGGYFGIGGGICTSYYSDPIFDNLEITHNHADWQGGGLYSSGATQSKTYNCLIDHNTSKHGGGIYFYGSSPYFYNTIISNNQTTDGPGGGIYSESGNPVFTNVTITGNTVISESYDYYGGAIYNFNSNPIFTNSILWSNSPNEIEIATGTVTAEYSDIEGSYAGTGNINSDPLFETTINGIYDLGEGSPCINTGTPDTTGLNLPTIDFADNPRIVSGRIDMGAYEYQGFIDTYELNVTVFLEGPFNGTDMNAGLNDIPLEQPYNIPPWNYAGLESVSSIPAGVVDWILIELRLSNEVENATPTTMIARQAAFLLTDGSVVGLDGLSPLIFLDNTSGIMNHVVVWHRNHLGIISIAAYNSDGAISATISLVNEGSAYNSEIGGFKELGGGIWGMVAGNANSDETIDILDKNVWGSEAGSSQYLNSDFNLDGQINNTDKNDYWQMNMNNSSQIPD